MASIRISRSSFGRQSLGHRCSHLSAMRTLDRNPNIGSRFYPHDFLEARIPGVGI